MPADARAQLTGSRGKVGAEGKRERTGERRPRQNCCFLRTSLTHSARLFVRSFVRSLAGSTFPPSLTLAAAAARVLSTTREEGTTNGRGCIEHYDIQLLQASFSRAGN